MRERFADDLFLRITEMHLRAAVEFEDIPFVIEGEDDVRGVLKDAFEIFGDVLEAPGDEFAFRDFFGIPVNVSAEQEGDKATPGC